MASWDHDVNDVQAIEKCCAEPAGDYFAMQIAARRSDDTDVSLHGRARAAATDFASLDKCQQRFLQVRLEFADLVYEQRSTARAFQAFDNVAQEFGAHACTGHRHEWPEAPSALFVDTSGDSLFSKGRATADQNSGVRPSGAIDLLENFGDREG
jgi:hypothetical protein